MYCILFKQALIHLTSHLFHECGQVSPLQQTRPEDGGIVELQILDTGLHLPLGSKVDKPAIGIRSTGCDYTAVRHPRLVSQLDQTNRNLIVNVPKYFLKNDQAQLVISSAKSFWPESKINVTFM